MSSDAPSGDLLPSQGADDIHTPTRKKGRSGTRLRELVATRNADHRLPIRFDMQTCKPLGENSTKFISYVALLGRSKASILCDDWDHVPENVKNQIWQSILVTYDVPNTNLLRTKWISYVGERWKNFKTMLTSHYIYGSKTDKSPCEKYQFLDEETWQAFKLKRLDPAFQAKRRAAQEIAKKNVHPHILSRGGYEKLEQKMMKEASTSNPIGASDTSAITRLPRHVTWKRARQRPSGEYTSEETASIAKRIDELVEQSTQGTFTPEGREDILAVAIGRPEHSGRVRGVGKFIGIRQFFGPPTSHHSKAHVSEEVLKGIREEIRQEMREEINEMKKEYGDMRAQLKKEYSNMRAQLLADVRAEFASSSSQPRNFPQPSHLCISTKESCDVSPQNASPTIDADYELFSDDALQCLVALGKMYTLGSTMHHETITTDMMRVVVVDVRDATARVPVPTEDVQTVGQAPGNFILWPLRLSRAIVKKVEAQGQEDMNESLQQQSQPSQQIILEQLGVLAVKISLSPIELQMPPEVTNRTSSLSFFICQKDIFEILSGTDMLCISILQLWLLYLHRLTIEKKNDHIYGFIDPVAIQGVGNKGEEVQNYLLQAFVNGKKQVYLAPYLQQGHWQLLLILPQQFLVVLLCSLHKKPHTLTIKNTLILVVEAYSKLQGTHIVSRKKLQFIAPTCSRQLGSFECGYYVMRHMQKIISANVVDSWKLIFDDTSPMEQQVIKDVREQWAAFLLTICK
ncbi:uncharacterized protein LOC128197373 [Vigna angularis]|uniref:uncharacterized protein LOC128197373 n=1 Tax=Phaseolus angularis TaxID=3914 RepID=UPI0022B43575|nr:uncharacterized protein LOC128197373 [Vigna angularis]